MKRNRGGSGAGCRYGNLDSVLVRAMCNVALKHMKHIFRAGEFVQPHRTTSSRFVCGSKIEQIIVLENEVNIHVSRGHMCRDTTDCTLRSPKAGLDELPQRPLGKSSHSWVRNM